MVGEEAFEAGGSQGGSEAETVGSGAAQCVFEIMHDALREVIATLLEESDLAPANTSMPAEAKQLCGSTVPCPAPGQSVPGQQGASAEPACAAPQPSTEGVKAHASPVSAPAAAGQEAGGVDEPDLEVLGKLVDMPHAASFVEYVFERMIFGLMQELLASPEHQAEGG